MAKTGTSLIGRADTTLVQGAYKTALSNVGQSLTGTIVKYIGI